MEAVTAFIEGPGCFLIVWALCARKAWRYVAVVLVSLGQLYGDVLYFGTCIHGGEGQGATPACERREGGLGVTARPHTRERGWMPGLLAF
jgi:hypothetical protein